MQDERAAVLVRNLLEVFNERDEAKRLLVIQEIYTEDATFFETDQSFQGLDQINHRVTEVLQTLPADALFRTAGNASRNHDVARLAWTLAAEAGPAMAGGMDVAVLDGGRISELYLFLDPGEAGR